MAHTRRTSGVDVVFDKNSLATFHSRSSSNSSCESDRSSDSLGQRRRRARSSSFSSSSSTSSRTSSRSRSRSHPRCHRRSSRCRCDSSRRSGLGRYSRSPPRRQRAHSRSHSRSAHVRPNRDHSKSSRRWNRSRYSRPASGFSRTYRSRSRSPARSVSLSLDDKKELLEAAKVNAMKILGVENLELPESVQPTLSEQSGSEQESPEPGTRVPQLHTESFSQVRVPVIM
ncbi:arginine/serine-rich protein 1-like%2C partial [Xyrichtys novacula]|uniref:Arginine/serine-rich protein 1 n=1 Tax=Xyrichtys novacula TaxID=13765 RepID=A0AAV1GKC2_XYRNO|nr:arginine/serine-rich protein 1-like%2C partial [Xyrichtys novacula]